MIFKVGTGSWKAIKLHVNEEIIKSKSRRVCNYEIKGHWILFKRKSNNNTTIKYTYVLVTFFNPISGQLKII